MGDAWGDPSGQGPVTPPGGGTPPTFEPPPAPGAPAWGTAPPQPGWAPAAPPTPPPRNPRKASILLGLAMGLGVGLLGGLILGFIVGRATGGDGTVTITGGSTSGGTLVGADEVEPASVESSREDPVPLGTPVDIGNGWRVEVQSFDAEPELDQAFDAPPGKQFVTAYLVVTYVEGDDEATSPFFGLDISMVGAAGVEYSQSDAACFAPEPEFDNLGDLYVGGVAEGNFCVAVSSADLDELVLVAEPSLSFNDDHKSYFALS